MHHSYRRIRTAAGASLALFALALAGCGETPSGNGPGGPGAAAKSVGFVTLTRSDVPVETELTGRTSAYRVSDVRPQISGILQRRLFTEGSMVRAGQPLYEIDPAPYRAALAEAQANLKSAQASAEAARVRAERYKPLAAMEAVSQQDYTDALAATRQAEASVAQRSAQLDTARINMRYTTVPAPISGRIGRSLVTDGALVTANQATALAQINQLDPIYVDIQQSAAALLALRRSIGKDGAATASGDASVRLRLEDGSDYAPVGRVRFSETLVEPTTGTVTLRAEFPNPDGLLLPGMFVTARFAQAIDKNVFLVPQAAVQRDETGQPQLWIANKDDKAELRKVTVARTQGKHWVVTAGLEGGERIITQGTGNLRAGQAVEAVPAETPQTIAPPGETGDGPRPGAGG